ncbi:MAG: cyanophycin synthetase, partial [bacterium]
IRSISAGLKTWTTFGADANADYVYSPGRVTHGELGKTDGSRHETHFAGTFLDNEILGLTAAAASAALRACGFSPDHVAAAAKDFEQLPHRMQRVAEVGGVEFVDNSKATNVAALFAALKMCNRPVRLIAGGRPKETDFSLVKELLATKGVMVYLIGESSLALASAWRDVVKCKLCETLAAAVESAWRDSIRGETVLLAPGCTSFDQFKNFEDRGEQFSKIVKSFVGKEKEKSG